MFLNVELRSLCLVNLRQDNKNNPKRTVKVTRVDEVNGKHVDSVNKAKCLKLRY